MSIRVTLVVLLVIGLSGYAWFRSWFVALCGAIVLLALLERPDMPRSILGIQGFNAWNFLFLNVVLAWLFKREREDLDPQLIRGIKIAFVLYVGMTAVACLRLYVDSMDSLGTSQYVLMEYFLNPLRFLIPGILLFDGCRTRERVMWALGSVLLVYLLLSVQVVKYMGIHFEFRGESLQKRAARVIERDVGFHRVDMSTMLAGASWAVIAFSQLFAKWWVKLALVASAGVILLGQAMTAGRAGYVAWAVVGLLLCVIKWRHRLPLFAIAAAGVILLVPGVRDRLFEGFGDQSGPVQVESDKSEITAGRIDIWPHVIEEISKKPLFGYGREAMKTTGLTAFASYELGDTFGHPHNAYLEMLLDNGLVGALCILPIYFLVVRKSTSLFIDREDRLYEAAGGATLALFLAWLVASLGAQTLYPREGVVCMWATAGIALRLWASREQHKQIGDESVEEYEFQIPPTDAASRAAYSPMRNRPGNFKYDV